jgi:uncharacterized membrane protein YhhN
MPFILDLMLNAKIMIFLGLILGILLKLSSPIIHFIDSIGVMVSMTLITWLFLGCIVGMFGYWE